MPRARALNNLGVTYGQLRRKKTGGWARVPHGAKMRATDNHEVSVSPGEVSGTGGGYVLGCRLVIGAWCGELRCAPRT
jgi:hypothetical protein